VSLIFSGYCTLISHFPQLQVLSKKSKVTIYFINIILCKEVSNQILELLKDYTAVTEK
jgi:hypothetical protein